MTNSKQLSNLKAWETAKINELSESEGETLKAIRERVESEGFTGGLSGDSAAKKGI